MKSYNFIISEDEGIKFSKISGDYNKIHIDDLAGYNSLYGRKICHGCLLVIKVLNITNIIKHLKKQYKFNINVNFKRYTEYNKKITLKLYFKNNHVFIKVYQENIIISEMLISTEIIKFIRNKKQKNKYSGKIKFSTKSLEIKNIYKILENISKYVGMVIPGEHSLIRSINIDYSFENKYSNKNFKFQSNQIDQRIPIIKNKLLYKKFIVKFESLKRPKIDINFKKISKNLLRKIIKIKRNILIIGGSTGIGFDLMKLFLENKKIKIISTYNKNKIILKNKNLKIYKLDIEKNINLLEKIILKYKPLNIYYFATPKIYFGEQNVNLNAIYDKFFVQIPKKIIKLTLRNNCYFFYPSTTYSNKKSSYYLKKVKGEKILRSFKSKTIGILKIDMINTKQNLSILNNKMLNFRDYLEKNKNYQKKIFFN